MTNDRPKSNYSTKKGGTYAKVNTADEVEDWQEDIDDDIFLANKNQEVARK
jgi:hypothetical protein